MIEIARSVRDIEKAVEYEQTHRMSAEEMIERERMAGFFGAFTQEKILRTAPRTVRANLRRSREERWRGIKMDRQYFTGLAAEPPTANLTAVVATTETGLWLVPWWTPILAFEAVGGRVYELLAGGIMSTGASGTLTITPRYGTTTGGVTLGASQAQTVVISLTNVSWFMHAILTIRSIGIAASTGNGVLNGMFQSAGAAATAGSGIDVAFGGTVATTCDTSTAQGLFIGWTLSVAGSNTPQQVLLRRVN